MSAKPALIDTHAHLDDDKLRDDVPAVLDAARSAGLVRIVAIATTAASTRNVLALAANHPHFLSPTAGIHPNNAAEAAPGDWDEVAALAARPEVVALGETGLDRHWDFTPFAMQEDYFARHLALARKLSKPVVIHCREADVDVLRMLRDDFDRHGPVRGVMHSFAGTRETAEACLGMGLFLSFSGVLTYKNANELREVASKVPHDRVMVETDSPYLAPVPLRGKRNEPAYVVHTAATLAGLLGLELSALADRTTANARALFNLPV